MELSLENRNNVNMLQILGVKIQAQMVNKDYYQT